MAKAQIDIEIAYGGETKIAVKGHAGPGCKKLTEAIEKSLGKVTADEKTPEFHHAAKQGQQVNA